MEEEDEEEEEGGGSLEQHSVKESDLLGESLRDEDEPCALRDTGAALGAPKTSNLRVTGSTPDAIDRIRGPTLESTTRFGEASGNNTASEPDDRPSTYRYHQPTTTAERLGPRHAS
ncbi:hypothetical protein EYF80_039767 [Liparis tanakae]|uniref:Uncharacterized protein n=1 Tax=Liparis tanakae TaxID=230148 RepID=A0A4Z2G8Z3_9TELE|nr:hypothetical protein EYF80_039767 [Liparis tanakae]